jgi:hypothetical protein
MLCLVVDPSHRILGRRSEDPGLWVHVVYSNISLVLVKPHHSVQVLAVVIDLAILS